MKRILTAGIGALVVCAAGTLVNYLYFQKNDHLLLSVKMHGGEITVEHGFALRAVHIYGMTQNSTTTHSLGFSPLGLLASLLLSFLLLLGILALAGKLLKK